MKKILCGILAVLSIFAFVACGSGCSAEAIELMGAGDRIHDSYTFANTGVSIKNEGDNVYLISGSVEELTDENVKEEFNIDADITHVVAIKLTATCAEVEESAVEISVDGVRSYDAEHLNGSDYTFIILEATPGESVTISVKWNSEDETTMYTINFDSDLKLK